MAIVSRQQVVAALDHLLTPQLFSDYCPNGLQVEGRTQVQRLMVGVTASRALIERAFRWRKVLGGGMRQAGILAAAGLYALEHNVARLADDHENARNLAEGLSALVPTRHATNMVFAEIPAQRCADLEAFLAERGILASITPETRFVTHLDIGASAIATVTQTLKEFFA